MITTFPALMPDELLWSAFARWDHRFQKNRTAALLKAITGTKYFQITVAFPKHLRRIAQMLPPHCSKTAESLLEEHTLFRLAAPFVTNEDREAFVRRCLDDNEGSSTKWERICAIDGNTRLKFCVLCRRSQLEQLGFSYWCRKHQAPGVTVCHSHHTPLTTTDIKVVASGHVALDELPLLSENLTRKADRREIEFANDAAELLDGPGHGPSRECIQEAIRRIASQRCRFLPSAYYLGLLPDLVDSYVGKSIPVICNKASIAKIFSVRISYYPDWQTYTLVARALNENITSLLRQAHSEVIEVGPWPCLFSRCSHFNERVIDHWSPKDKERDVADFHCPHCQQTYRRRLPLQSKPDGTFEYEYCKKASLWAEDFSEKWKDPGLSWGDLCLIFGITQNTVVYRAQRLGLPSMPERHIPRFSRRATIKKSMTGPPDTTTRDKRREQWLKLLKKYNLGRICQTHQMLNLRDLLYRYDRIWYKAHFPKRRFLAKSLRAARATIRRERDDSTREALGRLGELKAVIAEWEKSQNHRITLFQILRELSRLSKIGFPGLAIRKELVARVSHLSETREEHFARLLMRACHRRDAHQTNINRCVADWGLLGFYRRGGLWRRRIQRLFRVKNAQ